MLEEYKHDGDQLSFMYPRESFCSEWSTAAVASTLESEEPDNGEGYSACSLMKSSSISGSKYIGVQSKTDKEDTIAEEGDGESVAELTDRVASLRNS
ncbi:BnaA08g02700D [Brassica napus]|uniref:BnaA08g02700D protein n=1 Tax=Brassica napus TaxID=3708 RepID=A0A078FUI7_BRANA|nr:BnaA08g02700D [Brassica napus]